MSVQQSLTKLPDPVCCTAFAPQYLIAEQLLLPTCPGASTLPGFAPLKLPVSKKLPAVVSEKGGPTQMSQSGITVAYKPCLAHLAIRSLLKLPLCIMLFMHRALYATEKIRRKTWPCLGIEYRGVPAFPCMCISTRTACMQHAACLHLQQAHYRSLTGCEYRLDRLGNPAIVSQSKTQVVFVGMCDNMSMIETNLPQWGPSK